LRGPAGSDDWSIVGPGPLPSEWTVRIDAPLTA